MGLWLVFVSLKFSGKMLFCVICVGMFSVVWCGWFRVLCGGRVGDVVVMRLSVFVGMFFCWKNLVVC